MMTKEEKDLKEWERYLDLERKTIKLKLRMVENGNTYFYKRRNK